VVSGQTAHELTKPKTSEDSQFFVRLLRITLRFPRISRILGIFSKLLRTAKKLLINGKKYIMHVTFISITYDFQSYENVTVELLILH